MNKSFYHFAMLLVGLSMIFGLFESVLFSQLGVQIYSLPSFPGWVLLINLVYLISTLFLLKYYQYKNYRITFWTGVVAIAAFLFHFFLFYSLLRGQGMSDFYIPSVFLYLGTGFLYALSLVFSRAGQRSWLKAAGVSNLILYATLLSTFTLSLSAPDMQANSGLEKIQQWTSVAGNLFLVFFILNFRSELKSLKAETAEAGKQGYSGTLIGIVGIAVFLLALPFGFKIASEANLIEVSSWKTGPKTYRQSANRNYDSLLVIKNIPPIERNLSSPNPSREARALYRYLNDIYGERMLSGQMSAPWGIDELSYIREKTGKEPALRGIDFIHQRENAAEVKNAIDWWNSGGIPTIMWHWGGPGIGEGYENSKKRVDIDNCFIEGTEEHKAFWAELKAKADLLEQIRDAHVPVLWRPFHELNGHWFWYGKQGPERFKKLWITMYDYFVHERGLNNLIWVLCYTGSPDGSWFPGDAYVDIAAADTYDGGASAHLPMITKVKEIVQDKPMPIAYHECGVPPDPDACLDEGAMWLWWMEWHTSHLNNIDEGYLNFVYQHELVITKEELPDIMAVYGEKEFAQQGLLPVEEE